MICFDRERCICCGADIPEGLLVCPTCYDKPIKRSPIKSYTPLTPGARWVRQHYDMLVVLTLLLLAPLVFATRATYIASVNHAVTATPTPTANKENPVSENIVPVSTPAPAQKNYPVYKLSSSERTIVEKVVAAEARGEPYSGQLAVAQVIKDRSQLWGQDITTVCTAPGQFARPYNGFISDSVKQAVSAVFDHGERAYSEKTIYFYAYRLCSPDWAAEKTERGVIGNHRFMG